MQERFSDPVGRCYFSLVGLRQLVFDLATGEDVCTASQLHQRLISVKYSGIYPHLA